MANGMYINHALFITSSPLEICLYLSSSWQGGNKYRLISCHAQMFFLLLLLIGFRKPHLRYKHGPWRRIVIAITHLDSSRDSTMQYHIDFAYYSAFRPDTTMLWGGLGPDGSEEDGAEPLLLPIGQEAGNDISPQGGSRATVSTINPLVLQLKQKQARKATLQWGPLPRQPLLRVLPIYITCQFILLPIQAHWPDEASSNCT